MSGEWWGKLVPLESDRTLGRAALGALVQSHSSNPENSNGLNGSRPFFTGARARADALWVGKRAREGAWEDADGQGLEVLSVESHGDDASERVTEKSRLGDAPFLRSAFCVFFNSSHERRWQQFG